jgi:hypothetical protein
MRATGVVLATLLLTLGGCQKAEEKAAHTINDSMTKVMEPSAEAIWDTMSKAYNDKGDALDPSKLTEADWKTIADASAKMKARAEEIANAKSHVVAGENEPILGSQAVGTPSPPGPEWQAVDAAHVQKLVDAKPDLFKQKALALVDSMAKINRAAGSKDVAVLYSVGSELDEVCDSCHEPFWGTDVPPPAAK